MSEAILHIPLRFILPHPANRRVGGFDESKLAQLAESIKAVGVQQPAVVRQIPDGTEDAGLYQLVAGERRWRAAKLAGLEALPCVVRELSDEQALRIQVIENVQREDVHPLDEADGYQALIDAGDTAEHVAEQIGKSLSYVYQRLKLRELIPSARALLEGGKITAGHAILIARLPGPEQERVLEYCDIREDVEGDNDVISVRDLDEVIHREVLMELDRVPWKLDDAELPGGPCTTCPKRAGYTPALFADVCIGKADYCTDRPCYTAKRQAFLDRRKAELEEDGPVLLAADSWSYSRDKGVVNASDWQECKKSEEGAQRVLIVEGEKIGRATWGKKIERGGPALSAEDKERRRVEEVTRKIDAATEEKVLAALRGALVSGSPAVEPVLLLRLVAKSLLADWNARAVCDQYGWDSPKKREKAMEAMSEDELARILAHIQIETQQPWRHEYDARDAAVKLLGIDRKALRKQASAEVQAAPARKAKKGKAA